VKRGYVRIYRCIEDNILFRDPEPANKKSAWIDLILMANHQKNEILVGNTVIVVKRGQKYTSTRKLAQRWGWSRNRVMRYLTLLESEGMVYKECIGSGTLLTLVNYGKYQGGRDTNGATNEATDEATSEATNEATSGAQTIMNKNDIKNDLKNDLKKDPDFLLGNGKPKPKRE
jgi:DNA replication protein DnaD